MDTVIRRRLIALKSFYKAACDYVASVYREDFRRALLTSTGGEP